MDADLIKSILSVIAASIPLIIAIIALMKSRPGTTTLLNDSPSLKVLKIKREPVEQRYWRQYKLAKQVMSIVWVIPAFILYGFLLSYVSGQVKYPLVVDVISASFGVAFLWISYMINRLLPYNYIFGIKNAYKGRYFLFQSISIEVETDYYFLFNKCHETLKALGYPVIEVDADQGVLEANFSHYHYSTHRDAGIIKVKIDRKSDKNSGYIVSINIDMFDTMPVYEMLTYFSKMANHFVNQLISKPKDTDENTVNKKDLVFE